MSSNVIALCAIDSTNVDLVGGKGANLGELGKIEGVRVPDGVCVSTQAFQRAIALNAAVDPLITRLSSLAPGDRAAIAETSGAIRRLLEGTPIPDDVAEDISLALAHLGENEAYAMRSSATAEDLPGASFAGQQDTFLNVIGTQSILTHVARCWASLFTDRAVTYRIQNGFDHRNVLLSVVIQKMVFPQVSRARSSPALFRLMARLGTSP
jgi:pyruvate,water dikinase